MSNKNAEAIKRVFWELFGQTRLLHPARVRADLDWVTLDKLVAMNPDVAQFLETVRIDLNANRIHDGEYDPLPADPDAYAPGLVQPEGKAKKGKA